MSFTFARIPAVVATLVVTAALSVAAALSAVAMAGDPQPLAPKPGPARPRLGMNLNGPADWNSELPFVDVFRLSRPWISQREGQPWGKGPELELDVHGWVKRLEPGCFAETPLCTIEPGHYPGGRYTVLYDGRGELDFSGAATEVSGRPGRIVIEVDPSRGGFFLQLKATDPEDYVRNIRVIMPGFEQTYRDNPFHPVFFQRWQGVACLRFMDWMHTNGSKIRAWSDRPKPDDATFCQKGVAPEVMIDLCNRLETDAWFCMPHLADDEYVRRLAELVCRELDPKRKVYIEYSNEVWNTMFPQTRYSWDRAKRLGIGSSERPWEGGGKFYARRSVEIFKIWEEAFGGCQRLVRVLAWQSGNTWWMEQIVLPYEDAYRHADALAIAPYVSMNVPREGKELTSGEVEKWTVQQALDHLENESLPRSIRAIRATKETADRYGLKLIAYEGGQHMVGVAGGENSQPMTRLFHEANAHARMGNIYDEYYRAWTEAGGDLFCYFSSVGRWSKWGSWGIMQYYDDDPAKSPKLTATLRWARSCGQPVRLPE
ncbi:MAG: hypothetical protein JXB62_19605 [Pirellulales bacterium]|nr:hypothetical protein [Pirellulales bacterium]